MQNKKNRFLAKSFLTVVVLGVIIAGVTIYKYPYVFHAINSTYLNGQSGPGIYDLDISPYKKIASANSQDLIVDLKHISPNEIPNFISFNEKMGTVAFLVSTNDTLIFEYYDEEHNKDMVSNSFSMAKTVVSLLIGIAVEEGRIKSLDDPITTYLPELNTPNSSKVKIRHLLQMAGSSEWDESAKNIFSDNASAYYGSDLKSLVFSKGFSDKPGEVFDYKSGETQFLTYIIENVYGQSLSSVVEEKIWIPMKMSSPAYWSTDGDDGDEKGYCCLYATARDFLKLGDLFIQEGKFGGNQIVPSWYINEMQVSRAPIFGKIGTINKLYGLHVWLYPRIEDPLIYFRGILGQYIIVSPDKKWIAVRLGHRREEAIVTRGKTKNQIINEGHSTDFIEYVKFAEKIIQLSKP